MAFQRRTLMQIADMICGNFHFEESFFPYRSSKYLTEFFEDVDTDYRHDGSTRQNWVADTLKEILAEPRSGTSTVPDTFLRVIQRLMDRGDAMNEGEQRAGALALLNAALEREGFEAFYAPDKQCYLRHIPTNTIATPSPNPHRPFSEKELKRREQLLAYLETASEDALIEEVLLPLFRQLGFHRVTAAGHKDKALEYGKDVWMKFTLPTQHVLYFGVQAKKGKLDTAGSSRGVNSNIAEIHNSSLDDAWARHFRSRDRQTCARGSCIHRRWWRNYEGGAELARQQAGRLETQSDLVHGPQRYSEPVRRHEPSITE